MTQLWATLPYRTYRVAGDDAKTFLQGQLTQDVDLITSGHCRYAAYCNHQGRMFANILLFALPNDDAIYLRLHEAQADSVIKRLSMFVLRSAVTITEQSFIHLGLNAAAANCLSQAMEDSLPEPFCTLMHAQGILCGLPNHYYEAILQPESSLLVALTESEQSDAVNALRLQNGHFNILPETDSMILPQQTPLESWGGISYTKGCYVGQEIIARNKYLGKVKKGLASTIVSVETDVILGSEILQCDKKVGQVIEYQKSDKAIVCLALVTLNSLGQPCSLAGEAVIFQAIDGAVIDASVETAE